MLSVGETLKRARLNQGLDLGTLATRTKISAKYLEAIESDDRKSLPSGFFYRSFVEQYARALSLDTQEIDAEVNRVLSADEPLPLPGFESVVARNVPPLTSAHRFHTRRSYTSAATLVLVIVGCSGIYAWWHEARSIGLKGMGMKGVIGHLHFFAKPAVGNAKAAHTKAEIAKVEKPALGSVPPPKPAGLPASLASDTSGYKVLLDLMAREATWLSVSSDGKPVFSGTLQANETKTVGGKQFAKMRVGNAAGIEVRLNGKLLGTLGARGQVLTVLFTPDNFQIFSPPKESD
jgi:transcriptional regulator with XRE-family HTH domain